MISNVNHMSISTKKSIFINVSILITIFINVSHYKFFKRYV